jgi:HK97 family phage major capsid protein
MSLKVEEALSVSSLSQYGTKDIEAIGKLAYEGLLKKGIDVKEVLAKKNNIAKEDLDVSVSTLYTTAISGFIEKRLRPKLVAAGVIKKISNFDSKGQNSVKIPLRNALITAGDLGDNGAISYDSGTYGATTITLGYKYAANTITHEIMKFANVDIIAEELGEIGDAIARKVDSDIIAAVKAVSITGNSNYVALGTTTEVTFASLVTAQQAAIDNYAEPDVLLMSPETYATIVQLASFSGSQLAGAMTMGQTDTFKPVQTILGMKVVISQQVDNDDIYLIDTARTGYLVEAGSVEVFDGRRSGYLAYEVIGALNYGVGIVQPKAVYRIEENAA